jgi:hypothetical protein
VRFPPGRYLSVTIHLKSGVTLQLDEGATIVAAPTGLDPPEENPFARYQDFGHSHFRNALLVGEDVEDVAIVGAGTLDGQGLADTNSPKRGQGDKLLALRSCRRVRLRGVTLRHGGHIAIALNGCNDVTIDGVHVLTKEQRDGIGIVNSSNVDIVHTEVEAGDDAIAFKSDYALGRVLVSRDDRVIDSTVESVGNNALKIGTETCGDFRHILFRDVRVTGAGGAAIGIASLDGGTIESVTAERIEINHAATPVFVQLGDRGRCPGARTPGRIHDVVLRDVTGRLLSDPGGTLEATPTIVGMPGHPIEDVKLERVDLVVPGGHAGNDARLAPPEPSTGYALHALGVRPSYGWWVRHVRGLSMIDSAVGFERNDDRPALIVEDADAVAIARLRLSRGAASAYDVGLARVSGYTLSGATSSGADPLRVSSTASTPAGAGAQSDAARSARSRRRT